MRTETGKPTEGGGSAGEVKGFSGRAERTVLDGDNTMIAFTKYTSAELLTKMLQLGEDNQLKKKAAAQMFDGSYETVNVSSLEEFNAVLDGLTYNQATGYGLAPEKAGGITIKKHEGNGAIARSKKNFSFSDGPGVCMLDIDPRGLEDSHSADEVHQMLVGAIPELKRVKMLCRASASSNIYSAIDVSDTEIKKGDELIPEGGWHFYFIVDRASVIPKIGEILNKRLWLAGHGYILITGNGVRLERSLIDTCVWQGERLDFAAGAKCIGDVMEKRDADSRYYGAALMLQADGVTPLTEVEGQAYGELVVAEMDNHKAEAMEVREQWLSTRIEGMVGKVASREVKAACRQELEAMAEGGELPLDFALYLEEGQPVPLRVMLADVGKYHGMLVCDPVEPEYRGWDQNTRVNLQGNAPQLCSWSHGEKTVYTFQETKGSSGLLPESVRKLLEQEIDALVDRVVSNDSRDYRKLVSCMAEYDDDSITAIVGRRMQGKGVDNTPEAFEILVGEAKVNMADPLSWIDNYTLSDDEMNKIAEPEFIVENLVIS